ncbi:hypothetical protein F2Q70_00031723 [Brassica cretica]|uniref:BED-type domain-containing protein n=1 Tax=Brassica cretica TaxID=69181 RepID=A0A8S9FF90_BRACR|nr:hypothetical protein F2Q70_00031723 [Brassica cretica]
MSACEDNGDFLAEDVEADIDPGGGKKRSASERSSTDMPPIAKKKQAHRAKVWQHFIQREDDPSISNCRYCAQGIGCDSKKSGTSAMKNHIARCKMYQLYKESGKQQVRRRQASISPRRLGIKGEDDERRESPDRSSKSPLRLRNDEVDNLRINASSGCLLDICSEDASKRSLTGIRPLNRTMSACEDNGDFLAEDVEGDIDQGGGKKRFASERSSTDMPPVAKKQQAHRAEVWQHFIQREDDPSISNCRYCAQGIRCDSKKSGTSAMKNHIARCKMSQLYKESGKQQSLCKFRVNLIIRGWNVEEVKTNLAYHSLLDNLSF